MPLTKKGSKILSNMKKEYGDEKGERVFYASKNAGKIKDVEKTGLNVSGGKIRRTRRHIG